MKLLRWIWSWLSSFWRRTPAPSIAYEELEKTYDTAIAGEKPPMVRCHFCHRRTRLGRPCCNWHYLVIVAASLHIGGRRNPHRGFTDRISGHARASGQRRFRTRTANRRRMRERSIKVNRGLL